MLSLSVGFFPAILSPPLDASHCHAVSLNALKLYYIVVAPSMQGLRAQLPLKCVLLALTPFDGDLKPHFMDPLLGPAIRLRRPRCAEKNEGRTTREEEAEHPSRSVSCGGDTRPRQASARRWTSRESLLSGLRPSCQDSVDAFTDLFTTLRVSRVGKAFRAPTRSRSLRVLPVNAEPGPDGACRHRSS
jgi:hypothetical protein